MDVAEQDKFGAIGEAEANREKEIRVAENLAEAEKGRKKADSEQRIYVKDREAEAVDGENLAQGTIAQSNAELAIKEATAKQRAEVARRDAQAQAARAVA